MVLKLDKNAEIGRVYNHLTIESYAYKKGRQNFFLARCICGNTKTSEINNIRNGSVKSCGCVNLSRTQGGAFTKKNKDPAFYSWMRMKERCDSPNCPQYKNYGGRGIKVDPTWYSFEQFVKDMGPKPNKDFSLDRLDSNGDYCPSNCKWSSAEEQNFNRRVTRLFVFDHTEQCVPLKLLSRALNVTEKTIIYHNRSSIRMNKDIPGDFTRLKIEDLELDYISQFISLPLSKVNLTVDTEKSFDSLVITRSVWDGIKTRSTNKNDLMYPLYGARGLGMCEEWFDFSKFIEDVGLRPSLKHSLDRINMFEGYKPGNCVWATIKEQQNNKANTIMIFIENEWYTLTEASEKLGIDRRKIVERREYQHLKKSLGELIHQGIPYRRYIDKSYSSP